MPTVPPFTPVPGGYVTAQRLGDQYVIEGWWLDPTPSHHDEPCTQPIYHLIANTPEQAAALVNEFVADLTDFISHLTSRENPGPNPN
ncbi:hypothetical protein GCM10009601_51570 [Streptomyces thermospinosisporus]|uniref:Uncharacterized protein n=1 Tax=Streptomyces thermospinosisporus TaxID=161482 RepID=A0ABP4JY41_9ACTN